jgi:hypothetical protein
MEIEKFRVLVRAVNLIDVPLPGVREGVSDNISSRKGIKEALAS